VYPSRGDIAIDIAPSLLAAIQPTLPILEAARVDMADDFELSARAVVNRTAKR
jgi:hypothetical protein